MCSSRLQHSTHDELQTWLKCPYKRQNSVAKHFLSPSLAALSNPWPALPLGGVHCGRRLPRRTLHPREALLLLVILPAVPQREVARGQQRVHVLAGGRPHQHASPGQRRGEPARRQRRGLRASAAGQYCLTVDGCTAVGGAYTTI